MPSPVGISVPSPYHLRLIPAAGKSRFTRYGARHRPFPCRVVCLRPFRPGRAARPCSRIRPATVFWLTRQPASRSAAVTRGAPSLPSRAANSRATSALSRCRRAARGGSSPPPTCKTTPGTPPAPAGHRLRDAVLFPLGSDERGHGYLLPIASETQRATLRLRTSHRICSSAFSLRSRASSARSPRSAARPASRRRRSASAQLPRVPALIPRSRATCAIGLQSRGQAAPRLPEVPIELPACLYCPHQPLGRLARRRRLRQRPAPEHLRHRPGQPVRNPRTAAGNGCHHRRRPRDRLRCRTHSRTGHRDPTARHEPIQDVALSHDGQASYRSTSRGNQLLRWIARHQHDASRFRCRAHRRRHRGPPTCLAVRCSRPAGLDIPLDNRYL